MGFVGNALLQSAQLFGIENSTGVFLGFIFLTGFCGFVPLVIAFAVEGKKNKSSITIG